MRAINKKYSTEPNTTTVQLCTGWAKKMTQLVFVRTSSNLHQIW